ncbi:polysaccharide biosynthesis protein [Bacillus sp. 31A1R]|uniref:Polysaccharide biosynthesis protein n=1 Tax=Robertmurraya mangrovi TaxID=3098077 RepID=A0ABU5J268_9BACI|nr:polysaccharide biosynthesis protein [Bacillus sp. 31A1R]MDZ5473496.1 polysaccharide biosynthesis protein [Bacillus sp. 31A1R]
MNSFFRGTLLLIGATFLGECVEFLVNMVLAKELGEKGLGLYMSVLPTVFLIVLLASFELPVSISKFIAEKEEKYHKSMLQHVIKLTIIFTAVLLVLATIFLPFIPAFDQYHPLFRWLVIALIPMVSFSSIARGFFMGKQQMSKIATAHFLRKIVQLGLLVFLYQLFEFDMTTSVLIAFCTFVASEFVIVVYLLHMFYIQYQQVKNRRSEFISGKAVRQNLMAVSIPTTGLRIFHSLTHAVQPFLIKFALVKSGLTSDIATEQFGALAGVAMTIGFFPAFIAHSLLIMLIPTVSKAYSEKDFSKLQKLLQQVMLITLCYGVPAVIAFYFFAEPLTQMFFDSSVAASYLQVLWPYFLLHFFVIPMQAYLIGLGLMKDAFYHTVWSHAISFGMMYVMGSMHEFQMDGIMIGMNVGAVLLTLMHYFTICKKIGVSLSLRRIVDNQY